MHFDLFKETLVNLVLETVLSLVNLVLKYPWLIGTIAASDDFTEMRWLILPANLPELFAVSQS